MIRLPALLLAGCVVSAGLILLGRGSDSPLFERSPPATEIKTGAQAREIAEPLHGPTQRASQTASSDSNSDLGPPDVRLSGIVIEPDRRIAIFAVNGTKAVVLSEGEALKDWRIDSISPQEVSLSGPAGTMTLKPKPDANLVRPAPPAAAPVGHPQPDVPPRFFRSFPIAFPAPAGAPEQPTAATLIADEAAPAAASRVTLCRHSRSSASLTLMLFGIDSAGSVEPTIGPSGLPSMYSITGASTFQSP